MRRFFFYIILFATPAVIIIMAEGVVRLTNVYTQESTLFVDSPSNSRYLQLNPQYVDNYFAHFKPAVGLYPFKKEKRENTIRIFVLGGSTTAGFPYQFDRSFSSKLQGILNRNHPMYDFEIINMGVTALNSFAIRDFAHRLKPYKPDLVWIYAGHNEFYGVKGSASALSGLPLSNNRFIKNSTIWLHRSHLFLALKSVLTGIGPSASTANQTLMAQALSDDAIPAGSSLRNTTFNYFKANMSDIINSYSETDIPIVLSTILSNLRDQEPLSDDTKAHSMFAGAASGDNVANVSSGGSLYGEFNKAKDLDAVPFRAPSEINAIMRNLTKSDHAYLFDSKALVKARFGTPLPGDELFVDHLHFNDAGHHILAEAMADSVARLLELKLAFDQQADQAGIPLDALQAAKATYRIKSLKNDEPFRSFPSNAERQRVKDSLRSSYRNGTQTMQKALAFNKNTAGITTYYRDAFKQMLDSRDTSSAIANLHALFYYKKLEEANYLESVYPLFYKSQRHSPLFETLLYSVSDLHATPYYHETLAALTLEQQQLSKAALYLRMAEEKKPTSETLLYNYARYYILTGDTVKAQKYFNQYRAVKDN